MAQGANTSHFVVSASSGSTGLGAGGRDARGIDVGREHPRARLAELQDQAVADRPRPLHEHRATFEVVGSERVATRRPDRVEHADGGPLPRITGAAVVRRPAEHV